MSTANRFWKRLGGTWAAPTVVFGVLVWLAPPLPADEPATPSGRAPLPESRYEFSRRLMGMDYRVLLYAADESVANRAVEAVWERIAGLDRRLSDYDPESELSQLCRRGAGQMTTVSPDLFEVLKAAQQWSQRTDGAFDVTVGPLTRLWRRARRQRQLPTAEQLAAARAAVGYQKLTIDADRQRVELAQDDMRLDLGGIAVGYAVDESLKLLREHGIGRALIDGSGDIGASGAPPGKAGWRIELSPRQTADQAARATQRIPAPYVELCDAAVSTSGDAYQAVEIDGVRYSHIVDPATGLGLTTPSSVTAVARDCLTADVLATAVSVLGPERGLALTATVEGAAVHIVQLRDGELQAYVSPGSQGTVFRSDADSPQGRQ